MNKSFKDNAIGGTSNKPLQQASIGAEIVKDDRKTSLEVLIRNAQQNLNKEVESVKSDEVSGDSVHSDDRRLPNKALFRVLRANPPANGEARLTQIKQGETIILPLSKEEGLCSQEVKTLCDKMGVDIVNDLEIRAIYNDLDEWYNPASDRLEDIKRVRDVKSLTLDQSESTEVRSHTLHPKQAGDIRCMKRVVSEKKQHKRVRKTTHNIVGLPKRNNVENVLGSVPFYSRFNLQNVMFGKSSVMCDMDYLYSRKCEEGYGIYDCLSVCPKEISYMESMQKLSKRFGVRISVVYKHMLELFIERILYSHKYHYYVLMTCLRNKDQGLRDILREVIRKNFEKLNTIKKRSYWEEVLFFSITHYRAMFKSILPVSPIEQNMWKKFSMVSLPALAQGFSLGDFKKHVISKLLGISTSGNFMLEVINDVTSFMQSITDWILGSIGVSKESTTNLSKFLRVFVVVMVGGLIIQTGYTVVSIVWKVMASLISLVVGTSATVMLDLVDQTEYCEAQGNDHIIATLLNFGAIAAVGSRMPLSGKLSAARTGAPLVEHLWEYVKPFLNFCSKKILGYEYFIGEGEVPELRRFSSELIDLLATPDLAKRCVVDSNLMRKVQDMYYRSVPMRKVLLKTDCYDGPARTAISINIAKLDTLFASTLACSSLVMNRPTPVMIYLSGDPGQGKTTMLDILASGVHTYIMEARKRNSKLDQVLKDNIHFMSDYESWCKYPRVIGSEYWEGYSGQWLVQYNEIFGSTDPLVNATTSLELLAAIESCAFPLNRAFEEKGKSYFTSDIVIATSNVENFSNIGLREQTAFIRRLHCPIVVKRGQELKPDLSNLNEAWILKVKTYDVKGAIDAQSLGLLEELKTRKNEVFGVLDLIQIVGDEMINRYVNPSISQRSSKMPWSNLFKRHAFQTYDIPSTIESKYGLDISVSDVTRVVSDYDVLSSLVNIDSGAGIGFHVDSVEAQGYEFDESDSDSEDDDQPQVNKDGWIRYASKAFGSMFSRTSQSFEDDNDNIDDISTAVGSLMNFRKAKKRSQEICKERKYKMAIWLCNTENGLFDRLCIDYLQRRDRWHTSIQVARDNGVVYGKKNRPISSSDFGYLQGIDVFNTAIFHFGKDPTISPHGVIAYDEFLDCYHIYTCHEMNAANIKYDDFYNSWFARALRKICTFSERQLFISILGIGTVCVGLAYFGLKKLSKFSQTPTLDGDIKKIKTLTLAQSPKKEKLAMATRYKVAPRIIKGEPAVSHAQGQPVGDVEFAARCANILGNLRWVRVSGNRKVWTQGLFGTPMCLALPLHAWFNAQAPNMIEIQDEEGKSSTIYNRSQFDIVIPDMRDVIFIHFKPRVMPMSGVRDISRSIPEQPYGFVEHPIRLMKVLDEKKDRYANVFFSGKDIKFENTIRHNMLNDEVSIKMKGYYVMTGGGGTQGLCASPVVTRDMSLQNAPLLGMHIGRYGEDSIVAPLYKDDFHIQDKEHAAFSLISTAQGLNFKELFSEELSLNFPKGTSPYFKPRYPSFMMEKTELSKSAIFDYLPPPEVAPAMLRKTGDIDPLDKAKAKYSEHSATEMNRYTASLFNENFHYLSMFNRRSVGSEYAQLSFREAVFGTEDGIIEPMEKNTSSGYPDVCKGENPKRRDWIDDPVQLERLEKRSDDQIRELSAGIYSPQVVIDQLKDELRSLDRVQQGKTRLFCVGSITDCITAKRVLGRYLASQKKHLYYSAACIGHNPHDLGWGLLYERIERWPANKRTRWFGGDAGGFDYSIKRWEVELAFHYIYRTLPVSHQNVDFWKLVKGILYRVCTTIHVSRDSSYICEFRNSSGNWLTAWLNSFVMFSRIMACFLKRKPEDVYYEDYNDLPISLVVYGDDNLGSVREDVNWFDNVTLAQDMMELFQCQFTDPNKGEIKDRFLDLPSQIFLSRRFEVDGYHRVRAPLSLSSIMGMLYYVRGNTREEKLSRLKQNIVTAMQELCHYDVDHQKEIVLLIQDACAKANIEWDFDDPMEWSVRRSERSTDTFYFDH